MLKCDKVEMEVKIILNDKAIIYLIENSLAEKIKENKHYIKYTFYELRVKYNLSEQDTNKFLYLLKTKLQNDNYKVYLTGECFQYENEKRIVQDNELLIAIEKRAEKINHKTTNKINKFRR